MKRITTLAVAAALFASIAGAACGQTRQDELIKRRDAKLAEQWIANASWQLDYDVAREEAAKSGKLIFAYFTRSYSP